MLDWTYGLVRKIGDVSVNEFAQQLEAELNGHVPPQEIEVFAVSYGSDSENASNAADVIHASGPAPSSRVGFNVVFHEDIFFPARQPVVNSPTAKVECQTVATVGSQTSEIWIQVPPPIVIHKEDKEVQAGIATSTQEAAEMSTQTDDSACPPQGE